MPVILSEARLRDEPKDPYPTTDCVAPASSPVLFCILHFEFYISLAATRSGL